MIEFRTQVVRWLVVLSKYKLTRTIAARVARKINLKIIKVAVPQRIGHLTAEVDCFLKEYALKHKRMPYALLIEHDTVDFANECVVKYFSKYIYIMRRNEMNKQMSEWLSDSATIFDCTPYDVAMYETATAFDIYRRWRNQKPLFSPNNKQQQATKKILSQLGIPSEAWYVCLHARTGGYSPSDESWHEHRNVDIEDYSEAIDAIIKRGGWCIRMGDSTMPPMRPRNNVVDYAISNYKSDKHDVEIIAGCRFFLGCASGLSNVALIFGRPAVQTNMTPMSSAYSLGVNDLSLPKLVETTDGKALKIEDIFQSEIANYRLAEEFTNAGLVNLKSTPEDILNVVTEMLDLLDGAAIYSTSDLEKQTKFRSLFHSGHYSFGSGANISRGFLQKIYGTRSERTDGS